MTQPTPAQQAEPLEQAKKALRDVVWDGDPTMEQYNALVDAVIAAALRAAVSPQAQEITERDDDLGLDEVIAENAVVHLERMNDATFSLIVETASERACYFIGATRAKVSARQLWRDHMAHSCVPPSQARGRGNRLPPPRNTRSGRTARCSQYSPIGRAVKAERNQREAEDRARRFEQRRMESSKPCIEAGGVPSFYTGRSSDQMARCDFPPQKAPQEDSQ